MATASADPLERPLHIRWLGRVAYRDAHALQRGLHSNAVDDHLLLLEHPHVYTLGVRATDEHVLVDPASVGAELIRADRGGDVTYHGPGQLVGYPILDLGGVTGTSRPSTSAYVETVEQLLIDVLTELGLTAGRLDGYPGVWVDPDGDDPRKIAAIGVRLSRGRTMHGFALNVDPDMSMFGHIVPCGIDDKAVTSIRAEGIDTTMEDVVDLVVEHAVARWGGGGHDRHDVVWRHRDTDSAPFTRGMGPGADAGPITGPTRGGQLGVDRRAAEEGTSVRLLGRLAEAGVRHGLSVSERKPPWMRAKFETGPEYHRLKRTMAELDLVTVCEEAGCPNIFECWADGTATFMINGERCTRACGFCLVDTRKPMPPDPDEPERVAEAVGRMGLTFAVLTTVARDDLADGGAGQFAETIAAIRRRDPNVQIETLISDCKGDPESLDLVFDARPDVLNHNVETVPRLQRAVRPSASYARSLAVLARAKAAGLVTKSSLIVGMGETEEEMIGTLADLRGVGCDIVTIGQYLRPSGHHLPIARWWTPAEFDRLREIGEAMGIGHVESSPLTRSSYHARQAAETAAGGAVTVEPPAVTG